MICRSAGLFQRRSRRSSLVSLIARVARRPSLASLASLVARRSCRPRFASSIPTIGKSGSYSTSRPSFLLSSFGQAFVLLLLREEPSTLLLGPSPGLPSPQQKRKPETISAHENSKKLTSCRGNAMSANEGARRGMTLHEATNTLGPSAPARRQREMADSSRTLHHPYLSSPFTGWY